MSRLTDLLDRLRDAADDFDDEERDLAVRVMQDLAVLTGRSMQGATNESVDRELDMAKAAAASLTSAAAGKVRETFMDWLGELGQDLIGRVISRIGGDD